MSASMDSNEQLPGFWQMYRGEAAAQARGALLTQMSGSLRQPPHRPPRFDMFLSLHPATHNLMSSLSPSDMWP